MLRSVSFDPTADEARIAISRLTNFQRIATSQASRKFPAFPVNDAVAFFTDLSPRSRHPSFDFINKALITFRLVNDADRTQGFPGARMIIAVGPRVRVPGILRGDERHLASLLTRLSSGVVSARQMIMEAFRVSPIAGLVPALQGNFAFTKAYLADGDGSRANLGGPECYVDLALFSVPRPSWIRFSEEIPWANDGMSATFGKFSELMKREADRIQRLGIRNALEIADAMSISRYLP